MTSEQQDRIRRSRLLLGNPYAYLADDDEYEAEFPETLSETPTSATPSSEPPISIALMLQGKRQGDRFTRAEIEEIAREVQVTLWERRDEHATAVDVLDPSKALRLLGFEVLEDPLLGDVGVNVGVAGLLDRDQSRVSISPRFPAELQRFTLAHELGHVVLHQGTGLHRDRALRGSLVASPSNPEETEANIFAAAFLMPAKLVRAEFVKRFGTERFVLDDATAFALGDSSSSTLLPRRLARAEHFGGEHFVSLARHFRVSESAMAIRLAELELIR